ncbi:hypothetical protein HKD37_16G045449 [Glycine soja]
MLQNVLELSSHGRKVQKFGRPAAEIEGLVTITLDDVASLLHLPITGAFHSFETLHVDEAVLLLVELLEVSTVEAKAKTIQCHGAYCWIYKHFPYVVEAIIAENYHERKPRACRWTFGKTLTVSTYRKHLDRLTSDVVCWMSYSDHRAVREVLLLSYTDKKGLCGNLGMFRLFLHTLRVEDYA